MQKGSKILITVIAIVIFIVLFAVLNGVRGEAGYSTPGIFGLVLLAALIGALRAVWKKGSDESNGTDIEKK